MGTAAIQLCKTVENVTIFGTASASKHDFLKESGVAHPIDYRTMDYAEEIRKISPKGIMWWRTSATVLHFFQLQRKFCLLPIPSLGVDIVMDPLGGSDTSKAFNLLKPMGKLINYGECEQAAQTQVLCDGGMGAWLSGTITIPYCTLCCSSVISLRSSGSFGLVKH